MFELIVTVCLMGPTGDIYCNVPVSGLYLNKAACTGDAEEGAAKVMENAISKKVPILTVQALCRPRGQTPRAS